MYSVLQQDYPHWEIIFVDDASTDGSYESAIKWAKNWEGHHLLKGKNIYIHRREENGGYGPCLRDAFKYATGDLVAIVDADDAIKSIALSTMVAEFEKHPEASVVYSRSYWCNGVLSPYKLGPSQPLPYKKNGERYTLLECLDGGPKQGRVSHLKVVSKKHYDMTEGVGNLRKRIDKDLMLKMEEVGELVYIPDILYFYRDHPSNLTNLYHRMNKEEQEKILKASRKTIEDAYRRRGLKNGTKD
jgi:glycosyltransferase involved in cell wall biosynthesis